MLFRSLFIILLITVSPLSHSVLLWGPSGGPYMPTAGAACEAFASTLGHDDQYGIPIKTRLDGPFSNYYTCTVDYMNSGYARTRSTSLYQWDRPACPDGFEQQGNECVPAVPPKECPPSGTAAGAINLTIGSGGSVPSTVVIDGCIYSIPTHGHPDVDGSGNNCIKNADGSLNCFFSGTSDGKTGDECAPEDCPVVPPPSTDPVQTKPADTSTETRTDPTTGETNQVDTQQTTEILPDGTRKETKTETQTSTKDGQTTTTTTTTVVHHYQDGRQITTTNKTTTNPDGTTTTELSGTSEKGVTEGVNSGDEKEGKGKCDPTKPDYLECVKMVSEVSDGEAATIKQQVTDEIGAAIDQAADEQIVFINDSVDMESGTSALVSKLLDFIPQPTSCQNLTMSFMGYTTTIDCMKFQPFRQWLGWLMAVATIWYIFSLALTPVQRV